MVVPEPIGSLDATALPAPSYLAHLRSDAARLRAVAADALDREVPSCPGWRTADLVAHVAEVYADKTLTMRRGAAPAAGAVANELRATPDPLAAFDRWLAELAQELTSRAPQQRTWTWWPPDQSVGFWVRRMAQETLVHRWDAELAAGRPGPLNPALAADGVDELLGWLAYPPPDSDPQARGRVRVSGADHAWLVELRPGAFEPRGASGAADSADVTVTGEPADLLLWLWGRTPADALTVTGDPDVRAAFERRLALLRD